MNDFEWSAIERSFQAVLYWCSAGEPDKQSVYQALQFVIMLNLWDSAFPILGAKDKI
jgi:hypothetical protein